MHRLAIQRAPFPQDLAQMPGNGLALAIGVRGQIQRVGPFHRLGDRIDMFLVLLYQLELHGEVIVGVDGTLFGHEIAHMPV